jgi:hypothetical protein
MKGWVEENERWATGQIYPPTVFTLRKNPTALLAYFSYFEKIE